MSKNWYPVIDYLECAECGLCIKKCAQGVYNKEKNPTPVVINTDGCIEGCHGCGNICPSGAIQYVGENTDWTPPNGTTNDKGCCCCNGEC
jgi:NAD-dependent dihydropyrimidine dehydrogenase PreA subunit